MSFLLQSLHINKFTNSKLEYVIATIIIYNLYKSLTNLFSWTVGSNNGENQTGCSVIGVLEVRRYGHTESLGDVGLDAVELLPLSRKAHGVFKRNWTERLHLFFVQVPSM